MTGSTTMFTWIGKTELRELVWFFDTNLDALKEVLKARGMPETDWQAVLILKRTGDL